MDDPDIMLTNDDGIDAAGLHALREQLETVGSVTVVAPAEDQSAAGRSHSDSVTVHEHDLGYAVEGLPVDCVLAGLHSLCPETDLVVAGCNRGGNLGAGLLGRSGTVSAAVEAAFLDVPAMAVSTYIPAVQFENGARLDPEAHAPAAEATAYLVDRLDESALERADYLNVNAPIAAEHTGEMAVTRPAEAYHVRAEREGEVVTVHNQLWDLLETGDAGAEPGTDARAVLDGTVSISPLSADHTPADTPDLAGLAATYPERLSAD